MTSPPMLPELKAYGFVEITAWDLYKEKIKPRTLKWEESGGWIYAFVTEGRVRYIGMTGHVLRTRLDSYANQVGEPMRERIKECLNGRCDVAIFGLRRPQVNETEIKAEESRLIAMFKPDWNVRA